MAEAKPDSASGTVHRVLQLLSFVASTEGGFSVKDVAQELELAPSTAHRLLNLLVDEGFVGRGHLRRYRMGPEFLRVARSALDGKDNLAAAAVEPMRQVVDACGETCLLAVYHAHSHSMSFVARVDPDNALRYRVRMHGIEPLIWGSTGRAILAFLPEGDLQKALVQSERSPGSRRKLSINELRADLAVIRSRGYALSNSQRIEGAVGLAVPVFGALRKVVGCIGVTVPEQRFRSRDEARLATLLTNASAAMSQALGARDGADAHPPRQSKGKHVAPK